MGSLPCSWPKSARQPFGQLRSELWLHGEQDPNLDVAALARFLISGYVQAPLTRARGVRKIRNGHTVDLLNAEIDQGPSRKPFEKSAPGGDLEPQRVRETIATSMKSTLAEATNPGLLLSGGIDSVALAAIAADVGAAPKTYTFRYGDHEGRWNEHDQAADVARRLQLEHSVIVITPSDLMKRFDELVETYEEPFTYGVHSCVFDAIAADGVDLVMTGAIGATWATPSNFLTSRRIANALPAKVVQSLAGLTRRTSLAPRSLANTLQLASESVAGAYMRHPIHRLLLLERARGLLAVPGEADEAWSSVASELEKRSWELGAQSEADRFASLGLVSFGPEHLLWWIHRWATPHGIRTAFPYLHSDYVTLMAQASRNATDPRRDIVATLLPEQHARRPKFGQTLPLGDWLRGPMSHWARERIIDSRDILSDVFDLGPIVAMPERAHGR